MKLWETARQNCSMMSRFIPHYDPKFEKIYSVLESCKTTRQLDIAYKWGFDVMRINNIRVWGINSFSEIYLQKHEALKNKEKSFPYFYRFC